MENARPGSCRTINDAVCSLGCLLDTRRASAHCVTVSKPDETTKLASRRAWLALASGRLAGPARLHLVVDEVAACSAVGCGKFPECGFHRRSLRRRSRPVSSPRAAAVVAGQAAPRAPESAAPHSTRRDRSHRAGPGRSALFRPAPWKRSVDDDSDAEVCLLKQATVSRSRAPPSSTRASPWKRWGLGDDRCSIVLKP